MQTKTFSGSGTVPLVSVALTTEPDAECGRIDFCVFVVTVNGEVIARNARADFVQSRADGSSDFQVVNEPGAFVDPVGISPSIVGSLSNHVLTLSLSILSGLAAGDVGEIAYDVAVKRGHVVTNL